MAKKQTPEPIALPTQLSADDNSYLLSLKQQMEALQIMMNGFSNHLAQKYQLVNGDSLQPDGAIVRKAQE